MAKHEIIFKELRAEIAAGRFESTKRLPSEAQLVKRFSVSRPTVARALRDLESEGLIYRQAGAGTFLKSSSTKVRDVHVLGLLVPERDTMPVFDAICGELSALSRVHDFGLLWGDSHLPYADLDSTPEHAVEVCHKFIEKEVDGVFFAPMVYGENIQAANREVIECLSQAGIPIILLDRDMHRFPKRSPLDLVSVNYFSGGFMIAEHMIRLGCVKPCFLALENFISPVEARLSGMREAMLRYGIPSNVPFDFYGNPADVKFVKKLVSANRKDCILCATDRIANQLIGTLNRLGMDVPDQIRVAGFNDIHATLGPVPLTTVHQPCREIADVAFAAMQERIATPGLAPRTIRLEPRLVVRESCGTYKD